MGDTKVKAAELAAEVMAQAAQTIYNISDEPATRLKDDFIVIAKGIEEYIDLDE